MRKNKSRLSAAAASGRRRQKLPKPVIIGLVILLACLIAGVYIWGLLSRAGYFTVKDVLTRNADAVNLSYLKGKNIFTIDLDKEAGYIAEMYPNYSRVRLARVFPDRIFFDFIKPKPVAEVKLYRNFVVDEDAVLFYPAADGQVTGLPIIIGLETRIFGPKPGKRYNIPELILALNIIREIKNNRAFKDYSIKKINVANTSNASIFFPLALTPADIQAAKKPQELEVKISQEDLKNKIAILGGLLVASKDELGNIRYIDLRFKEYVIKPKSPSLTERQ
jgi:cell division septal protein FtsQ